MSGHGGASLPSLVAGVVLSLAGAVTLRYPAATYAIRTAWKHDDPSLSDRGRTDQRVLGGIVLLVGIGLLLSAVL